MALHPLLAAFICFLVAIAIIGIPTNITVLFVYGRRHISKTGPVTCVLLFAVSDIYTCLIGNISLIFTSLNGPVNTTDAIDTNLFTAYPVWCGIRAPNIVSLATVYFNLCLNVIILFNQYVAVTSVKIVSPMGSKRTLYATVGSLLGSFVLASMESYLTTAIDSSPNTQCVLSRKTMTYLPMLLKLSFFFIALTLITFFNCKIYCFIRRQNNKIFPSHHIANVKAKLRLVPRRTRRHIPKVTKMLVCSTTIFTVTWIPTIVVFLLSIFCNISEFDANVNFIFLITLNLNRLSSVLNPVVYALMNKHFRRECLSLWRNNSIRSACKNTGNRSA